MQLVFYFLYSSSFFRFNFSIRFFATKTIHSSVCIYCTVPFQTAGRTNHYVFQKLPFCFCMSKMFSSVSTTKSRPGNSSVGKEYLFFPLSFRIRWIKKVMRFFFVHLKMAFSPFYYFFAVLFLFCTDATEKLFLILFLSCPFRLFGVLSTKWHKIIVKIKKKRNNVFLMLFIAHWYFSRSFLSTS